MASCCIALTTDSTYLFPTLVAAMSARQHASVEKATVVIFCFHADAATERSFKPVCEREGIELQCLPPETIENAPAMMARLFLTRLVPAQYDQFLYMDGDILVTDSLDPLIDAPVPPGFFLAANDPFTFLLEDNTRQSRDLRAHLSSLGLEGFEARSYFNSGVLRIHREGWEEIGAQAWKLYSRNPAASRFPDQDAINLAGRRKRLPMSLRWNFPIFLQNARVEKSIGPRVHHFMSLPKPWHGRFAPWNARFCGDYAQVLRRYPQLAAFSRSMPIHRRLKYVLQQRGKQAIETMEWGFSRRRERVLQYEDACVPLSATAAPFLSVGNHCRPNEAAASV